MPRTDTDMPAPGSYNGRRTSSWPGHVEVHEVLVNLPVAAPFEAGPLHCRHKVFRQVEEALACVLAQGERIPALLLFRQRSGVLLHGCLRSGEGSLPGAQFLPRAAKPGLPGAQLLIEGGKVGAFGLLCSLNLLLRLLYLCLRQLFIGLQSSLLSRQLRDVRILHPIRGTLPVCPRSCLYLPGYICSSSSVCRCRGVEAYTEGRMVCISSSSGASARCTGMLA